MTCKDQQGTTAGRGGDVLIVSESVSGGKAVERLVEHLGLRARRVATLAAARTALRTRRPGAVLLDLPLADFTGPGDLPLPPQTRLLAFGERVPEGVASLGKAPTPDTLRVALAALLPLVATPPQPSTAERRLITDLLGKPGVLGVTLLTPDHQPLGGGGEPVPAALLAPLCGMLEARALGDLPQGGPLFSAQLEFEHRTLLAVAHEDLLILCVLRDPSPASLVRYLLRSRAAA